MIEINDEILPEEGDFIFVITGNCNTNPELARELMYVTRFMPMALYRAKFNATNETLDKLYDTK